MRQVTREEFYGQINDRKLDVHPSIQPGSWPYTSVWKFTRNPGAYPYGKSVGRVLGGYDYYCFADDPPISES